MVPSSSLVDILRSAGTCWQQAMSVRDGEICKLQVLLAEVSIMFLFFLYMMGTMPEQSTR